MKSLRYPPTGEVRRVGEGDAFLLAAQGWVYISKTEYRRALAKPQPSPSKPLLSKEVREIGEGVAGRVVRRRI